MTEDSGTSVIFFGGMYEESAIAFVKDLIATTPLELVREHSSAIHENCV
jgi:hypothetical protein